MAIQPGDLNRRITFLAAGTEDDGFTQQEGAFRPVAQRWASKRDVSDRERSTAAQQGSDVTTRFVVRWDSFTRSLSTKFRLECEGAAYTVSAVKEVGRREGVEITASRRDDGGL